MAKELILIVEDNPINLKLLQVLLKTENFETCSAMNAEEAMLLLNEKKPDLILMDIQLPGMDGLELTKQIKQNTLYKEIPIIAITAYAMESDKEKAFAAGCDGYISKPIDTRLFIKTITDFFSKKSVLT